MIGVQFPGTALQFWFCTISTTGGDCSPGHRVQALQRTQLDFAVCAIASKHDKPSSQRQRPVNMDSSREGGSGPVILISSVKQECRSLRSGFKQLARHLKSARCDVRRLDATAGGGITPSSLAQAAIVVFGGPTEAFMPEELDCLRAYLRGGGNLLVLGAEGCGGQSGSHLNALLADFGIKVASDCVIQTAFTRQACLPGNSSSILLRMYRALNLLRASHSAITLLLPPTHHPTGTCTPSKCWSQMACCPQTWRHTAPATAKLDEAAAAAPPAGQWMKMGAPWPPLYTLTELRWPLWAPPCPSCPRGWWRTPAI